MLLVDPAWLEQRLAEDPALRVIDASWYLPAQKRDARAEYAEAHIPGAIFIDLSTALSDPAAPLRNTLASPDALAAAFGSRGIGIENPVVVYDRLGGYSAGRVWWTLRYLGHERVSLLDGGYARWLAEGRPVTSKVPKQRPVEFRARPNRALLVDKEAVRRALASGSAQVVDARSTARFRGEGEEHTRHKGHMPGARSVPWDANLVGNPPSLRPLAELRSAYERAGVDLAKPIITTCGSGVTAALDAFALALLGHTKVSLYDGSWAEWGDSDDVPIATGDA
jgi:thiosulfate/3-mercaptopyruvate sulfurtransferase